MKNKATSIIKIHQALSFLSRNYVGVYLRDGPFSSDIGIVNLRPSKGTHWVVYINENYFDSYGCGPPKKLSKFVIKRKGFCLNSDYQIQENDILCAKYCLSIIYLIKVFGIAFNSGVLNLYFERIS